MEATSKGGDFKPSPQPTPATTFARCYSVVDFGTAEQFYNGESKGKERRIHVTMELPEFQYIFNEAKGAQPYVVGREMKLSSHLKSNLAEFVKNMRGFPLSLEEQAKFNPMVLLGKQCLLTFGVKVKKAFATEQLASFTSENSYLEIVSMSPLPNGIQEFPAVNPILTFDFSPMMQSGQFHHDSFSKLPKWMRGKIEKSDEFAHFVSLGQVVVDQQYNQEAQAAPAQQAAPVQQAAPQQPAPTPTPQQPAPTAPAQNPPAGTGAPGGW